MSLIKRHSILLVDDEKPTLRLLTHILGKENFDITTAESAEEAVELIKTGKFSIILSDICLGAWDGLALIPYVKELESPALIIFMTGMASMDTAMKALRMGAFDYVPKPADLFELETSLQSLVNRALTQLEMMENGTEKTLRSLQSSERKLVGRAPKMVPIYRLVAKAALSENNVLILGESGTGKELIAHAIHENSARNKGKFVPVNCGALTESLLESELFGHLRGSFTGATQNKLGLFEEAHQGTLFLDEIGDLSQAMQVKLLRALQEGEIRPVGSAQTKSVDVRIIAATHRNLEECIKEGKFREDLYYRLKVFLIHTPPLRERKQDIPELVKHFLAHAVKKTGKEISGVSQDALSLLYAYPWPGNIRELENAIERAVSMTNTSLLYPEDFAEEICGRDPEPMGPPVPSLPFSLHEPKIRPLEEVEQECITQALQSVKFNKSKAAEILGIDRGTLYRKAEKYGIPVDKC
jgi:two-component system, NtrC family, response regulator AtoC